MLVLNLRHSSLYRNFCKCLYVKLLKFHLLFTFTYIFFACADKKKACFHCSQLSKMLAFW